MSYRDLQLGMLLALSFCSLVATPGCEKSSSRSKNEGTAVKDTTQSLPNRYHFQAKYEDVAGIVEILINGFPVERGGGSVTNNPIVPLDLNTALIGKGNKLAIRVEPRMLRGSGLSISTVKVYGQVTRDYEGEYPVSGAKITESEVDSAYEAWSKRARAKWTEYREWEKQWLKKHPEAKEEITWKDGGALDSIRAWAERNPLTVSTTFDNEAGPDFSRLFEEAPVLEDTPATRRRLKDYAMQLRAIISNHNGSGLYREIRRAKNAQYRTQGKTPPPDSVRRAEWAEVAEKRIGWFAPGKSGGALTREKIGVRKWAGGRVWELYQKKSGDSLFDGWDIFVAEIEGELKVVRVV